VWQTTSRSLKGRHRRYWACVCALRGSSSPDYER